MLYLVRCFYIILKSQQTRLSYSTWESSFASFVDVFGVIHDILDQEMVLINNVYINYYEMSLFKQLLYNLYNYIWYTVYCNDKAF